MTVAIPLAERAAAFPRGLERYGRPAGIALLILGLGFLTLYPMVFLDSYRQIAQVLACGLKDAATRPIGKVHALYSPLHTEKEIVHESSARRGPKMRTTGYGCNSVDGAVGHVSADQCADI